MRASLTGIRPNQPSMSYMAGSTSAIKSVSNTISKEGKVNYLDELGFLQKCFPSLI